MVLLLALVYFGGYLLPLPATLLSWRAWRQTHDPKAGLDWRHNLSTVMLAVVTLAIPLWCYAAVRELRDEYSYVYPSAMIGRWSSLALFGACCFAEAKTRRYLLLACAGLLFFYGATIGEMP